MSSISRPLATLVATLVVGTAPVALVAAPASAHTDFVGSDPKDGATLREVPREVVLEFSDDMDPELSSIAVRVEDGRNTPLQVTGGAKPTVLVAQVPDAMQPAAGGATRWTVTFRVVSSDGHPVAGTTGFVVRTATTPSTPSDEDTPSASDPSPTANPDGQATGQAAADPADERGVWPLVAVGIGALVLLGGAVAATMRLTGRSRDA